MKLNWQKIILYLARLGADICWLYALLAMLSRQTVNQAGSVQGILVLFPVAFLFNLCLTYLRLPRAAYRAISWSIWVVSMLLMVKLQLFFDLPWLSPVWVMSLLNSILGLIYSFRAEVLILVSTGVLWWLGQRLALSSLGFRAMLSAFQFGLVMLVLVFLFASGFAIALDYSIVVIVSFFLFSLVGISIAHALEGTSWLSGQYRGQWSGVLLISIGVILLIGLLVGVALTPNLLQIIWNAIKLVWNFVWNVILTVLAFILSLLPEPGGEELIPAPEIPAMPPGEEEVRWTLPEWMSNGLRLSWIILVTGLLVWALVRISSDIIGWFRRRLANTGEAQVRTLRGAFKADILNIIHKLFNRICDFWRLLELKYRDKSLPSEAVSIRQVYRQFLRWGAKSGYPRLLAQTPYEYCYNLISMLPQATAELKLVTQRYVDVRYGMWIASEDELDELRQTWFRLKQVKLKKVIRQYKTITEAKTG